MKSVRKNLKVNVADVLTNVLSSWWVLWIMYASLVTILKKPFRRVAILLCKSFYETSYVYEVWHENALYGGRFSSCEKKKYKKM